MSKTLIPGRGWAAVCLSALLLASAGLAACGGSGSHTAGNTASLAEALRRAGQRKAQAPGNSSKRAKALREALLRLHRSHPVAPRTKAANNFRQALTRFASCLRQDGVDISAPSSKGNGPLLNTRGIKTNTPQFRAASAKCRTVLFSALRPAKR
jgi:hypothetical protein